jgi:hypothetical protein
MTLTNAHTSLKELIAELLALPQASVGLSQCNVFYDRLNDRKQGTMDFGPAMPKLDLLVAPVDAASWETFLNRFCSGIYSRMGPEDFVCPNDLFGALDVLECLVRESEAAVDPAFLEAEARRQSEAAAAAAAERAMSASRSRRRTRTAATLTAQQEARRRSAAAAQVVHPNAFRDPPTSFWRLLAVYRCDVQAFAARIPSGKMLTLPQALRLFPQGAAFVQAMQSGVYQQELAAATRTAEALARRRRDAERALILSQMTRMRLPNAEVAKAKAKQAAELAASGGGAPAAALGTGDDAEDTDNSDSFFSDDEDE